MNQVVNRPFYLFLRLLLRLFLRPYFCFVKGFSVVGGERLPQSRRPCILICNHAAFVDTLYLIAAVPPRFTVCGAQPKYFATFMGRVGLGILNIIKVENREQFINDCCDLLKSNEVILIYPAMGRVPDGLGEFKTWAAEVAIASGLPVIPLYLYGTTRGHSHGKRLIVGEEIPAGDDPQSLTRCFHDSLTDLESKLLTGSEDSTVRR